MDEIRSWFEVPAIVHYFHTFRKSFDLTEFDIEEFEETLFLDNAENVSSFLPDLAISLLRGLYKTKDGLQVTMANYNHYLKDLLDFHYVTKQEKENPLQEKEFKDLDVRCKITILYDMCNWRLELEDAMELTKNLDADEMRLVPLGQDNQGSVYWYFNGTRLYKESFAVKKDLESDDKNKENKKMKKAEKRKLKTKSGRQVKKRKQLAYSNDPSSEESEESSDESSKDQPMSPLKIGKLNLSKNAWSLICSTLTEWEELLSKFKAAKGKNEKELLSSLKALFEDIPEKFARKERALQKKLLAMAPKRASHRISLKMQQRESEERMLEQERLLKAEQKAKEAEKRQQEAEKKKAEERSKRYIEREKLLEDRALRAKQREEQKIIVENPELAKELNLVNGNSVKSKRKSSSYGGIEDKEEETIFEVMTRGFSNFLKKKKRK